MNNNIFSEIVWDKKRVFISPVLGCPAKCKFCYLESINISMARHSEYTSEMIFEKITTNKNFIAGEKGTIISLGCLSESLAPHSIKSTLSFLELLQGIQNPIQIATRWTLSENSEKQLIELLLNLNSFVFHSMTETEKKVLEVGTPLWKKRLKFIENISFSGLVSAIYIKPFIPNHTSHFINQFIELAKSNNITYAVVGSIYLDESIKKSLSSAITNLNLVSIYKQKNFPLISGDLNAGNLVSCSREVIDFKNKLLNNGIAVFSNSIDVINSHLKIYA